jgi:hypothetical protein
MSETKAEPRKYVLNAGPGRYSISGPPAALLAYKRLPKNSPINTLIGRVVSDWSFLEHILDRIIWELAGDVSLTKNLVGSVKRISQIKALCESRNLGSDTLERVKALSKSLYEVQELRNRVIHDPWYIEESTKEPHQYKTRRGQQFLQVNVSHLNETLEKIDQELKAVAEIQTAILATIT